VGVKRSKGVGVAVSYEFMYAAVLSLSFDRSYTTGQSP